ncbi:BLUF domain-containing protein [Pseudoalteromonas sp. SSDWG2]|uniref:BLUF domain-containing protein n=1 Tax=Pseudoalteromonas sp. SSDWG2 TaxID=3139391 RepID=UPI003BAB0F0E
MYLIRLIYASRVQDNFNTDDVAQILEASRKNNRKADITGLLCFNHKYFLQCLEGSRARVNSLYQRILHDQRHQDILLLSYGEVAERHFSNWSMGYIPETAITRDVALRFSGKGEFNPYEMTGPSAHAMMVELAHKTPTLD